MTVAETTTLQGVGVSPGSASGPVSRMQPPPAVPAELPAPTDPDGDIAAVAAAMETVAAELERRAAGAPAEAAAVLSAQAMMARDPALGDIAATQVRAGRAAALAAADAFGHFREALAGAGSYMAERVADLDDIRNRVVATLLGLPMPGVPQPGHPYVLVARDLAPADTATLDVATVLGIITAEGGPTSHTAILAKSLGLPAVVACPESAALVDGETVLLDGVAGTVVVAPDPDLVEQAATAETARRTAMAASTGPGRTADGHAVALLVNVGGAGDLAAAAAAGAEGVGLFRTEFLFLDRPQAPTVEEQRAAYGEVFAAFPGQKVVVRTLDAGADKPLAFATVPDEPNPALGVRGLRTSWRLPDLLADQLRAIAEAAKDHEAEVWVMAPMVATAAEAAEFADLAHAAGLATAGVMVEVPAAALTAEKVLAGCDFASLGTNDLSQYTYAADRQLGELAGLLDPWQPALLRLVELTAQAGEGAGKPVGVCGEAASDPLLAPVLVGLGVTSLSMAPVSVPAVRAALAALTLEECRRLGRAARESGDAASARAAVSSGGG